MDRIFVSRLEGLSTRGAKGYWICIVGGTGEIKMKKKKMGDIEYYEGSGNVYQDLGFKKPEEWAIKARIATKIFTLLTEKRFFRNSFGFESFRSCRKPMRYISFQCLLIHVQNNYFKK